MTYVLFATLALILVALAGLIIWLTGRLVGGLAGLIARRSPGKDAMVRRSRRLTYVAVSVFLAYSAYDAVYPSDDFFLGEYAEVTLRQAPDTARVIAKSASYPDLHGDYCSFSRIALGARDYDELLRQLSEDSRLSPGEGLGSQEEQAVQRQVPRIGVRTSFTRSVAGESDRFLAIRFLNDGAHVEVSVCIT